MISNTAKIISYGMYIIDHEGFPQNHNWVTTLMKGCSEASEEGRTSASRFCENCYATTDMARLESERREAEMREKRRGHFF
jgi:hypothetical protein